MSDPSSATRSEDSPDLSDATLRELAGSASFTRGTKIAARDLSDLRLGPRLARAVVSGTFEYDVRLQWISGSRRLSGECSCPIGQRGNFCKHCVAVALAWRKGDGEPRATPAPGTASDPDALISRAWRSAPEPLKPGPRAMRSDVTRTLGNRLRLRDFIAYRDVPEYLARIDVCIALIEAYASVETAIESVELCERALEKIELQLGHVDDSAGGVWPRLMQLRELHRRACLAGEINPEELAERLYMWNELSDWETFDGFPEDYRHSLGETGLAVVDRLARRRAAELGAAAEADSEHRPAAERARWHDHFRLLRVRVSLARVSGQVEDLVQAYGDQPDSWHDHLSLSRECEEFGRPDLALYWARVGLERYPEKVRLQLRVGELLERAGDREAAIAAVQDAFGLEPSLTVFKELHALAGAQEGWPDRLRSVLTIAEQSGPGYDLKVQILVWLGRGPEALAAHDAGGCLRSTRSALARLLEPSDPRRAVELHLLAIERTLEVADRRRYAVAVELLERCRDALVAAGLQARFVEIVEELRQRYLRRKVFVAMLDQLLSSGASPGG